MAQRRLDDHLRDSLSTKSLASHEILLFQSCQSIAAPCESQDGCRSNQTAAVHYNAEPLDERHQPVNRCSHVVGGEAADKGIELGRGRTDAEKERYFNEYQHEG